MFHCKNFVNFAVMSMIFARVQTLVLPLFAYVNVCFSSSLLQLRITVDESSARAMRGLEEIRLAHKYVSDRLLCRRAMAAVAEQLATNLSRYGDLQFKWGKGVQLVPCEIEELSYSRQ